MKSVNARSTSASQQKTSTDVDAFVAAVMRSHESLVRNLWRLAGGAVWPVLADAPRDREIVDSYRAAYRTIPFDVKTVD
jgi:hypothetical protein